MFVSERYLARLAKIRKNGRESPIDEQVALVESAFMSTLDLPDAMREEVFDLFCERIRGRTGDDGFLDGARYLGDVADLFAMQYDEEHDPIVADDWRLVGEIVNEWALDLDMSIVNYVMRLVVDHNAI